MTDAQQFDVDLDALVAATKRVKLGGKVYDVPGDIPMDVYIKVNLAGQKEIDGAEEDALKLLIDALVDLVSWNAPDAYRQNVRDEVGEAVRRFGVGAITSAIRVIYKDTDVPGGEPEGEPDPTPAPGTTTTTS
jgi:hypothetical protein